MTSLPDEAVQAAYEAMRIRDIRDERSTKERAADALTAALPFLTGVKVDKEALFDEMTRRFGNQKYVWETSEDFFPNPEYLPPDDTQIGVEFAYEFLKPHLSALSHPAADEWLPPEEWKPIETAPKDGTWVLAFYRKECVPAVVFYDEDTSRWCGQDIGENRFTHWRPLPASPEASK